MPITFGRSSPDSLGEAPKRSSRVIILAVILVAILIVGAVAWLTVQSGNKRTEYTKHNPIFILGNGGFTNASGVVRGSGTQSDPYVIADWDINTSSTHGIWIQDTDAHFIVRNCYIHNGSSGFVDGISLTDCVNGTLENNNCSKYVHGIYLNSASNNTLINNVCSLNYYDGICLDSSSNNNTLGNNTCSSNHRNGISLYLSNSNNMLSNNTCNLNGNDGIELRSSSNNNMLTNNNCNSNHDDGISVNWSSSNNEISWNQVSNNGGYGVNISSGSNNRLWYNIFIGNNGATGTYNASHAQARDDGTHNGWNGTDFLGNRGNYWSDWTTPDAVPPQGIVDHPYVILGSAGAKDYYPLSNDPRYIQVENLS